MATELLTGLLKKNATLVATTLTQSLLDNFEQWKNLASSRGSGKAALMGVKWTVQLIQAVRLESFCLYIYEFSITYKPDYIH